MIAVEALLRAEPTLEPKLTVRDVAGICRASRAQVFRLVKLGRLRPLRLPDHRKMIFEPDEIRRYLASGVIA